MPQTKGARRAGRFLWGPRRLAVGLSIAELAERSHVNRGDLSRAENGIGPLTGEQFERVMAVFGEIAVPPGADERAPGRNNP